MTNSILKLCFEKVKTGRDRDVEEMQIVDSVLNNGIEARRNIVSWQSSKNGVQYEFIISSTISFWISVLLISSRVLAGVFETLKKTVRLLPLEVTVLLFLLYRWLK